MTEQTTISTDEAKAAIEATKPDGAATERGKRLKGVAKMAADFSKHERVVAMNDAEKADLVSFVETLATTDEAGNVTDAGYVDWTDKVPENAANTLALVKAENGETRAIAIFPVEDALNNPNVRELLYDLYVSRIVRAARAADALQEQFATPDGALSVKFDRTAWTFQADSITERFNEKAKGKAQKVTARMLFNALKDASLAESQFPTLSEEFWNSLLDRLAKNAEANNYDASIFRHFKLTRKLASGFEGLSDETFGDLDAFVASPAKAEPVAEPAAVA